MMNGIFSSWRFVPIYGNFRTDDDDDHLPPRCARCPLELQQARTSPLVGDMNRLLIAKLVQIIRWTPWFIIDIFTYPLVN